jgi:cytochrome bd-type quinol oxidase subunit 2
MRPLVVLLGIVMGSAVSIALGLLMTGAVFLLLHDSDSRLADESRPLMATCLISVLLAAVAATSFYGELRERRWRLLAHAVLVAGLAFAIWTYWPKD